MNIYKAIIKAADSIDSSPALFDFDGFAPEPECGVPGCALGWVAFHAGFTRAGIAIHGKTWDHDKISHALGFGGIHPDGEFYDRMNSLSRYWKTSATECAEALRTYAEQYHGHEKPEPKGIPSSVRALFDVETA